MKVVNLVQGTPEWHLHRSTHDNASDAPAMMDCSQYITRNDFIKQAATGVKPEIDAATQRRFNDGHRFEALARPYAEKIIGDDLYPVIGTEGRLSASFDGLTMDYLIAFEHKMLNADIRKCSNASELRLDYRVQMEQQLTVSGAGKCLFMATTFDENEKLLEEKHFWYEPDYALREKIISSWEQFHKDVVNYVHVEVIDAPEADAIQSLPAVTIQVSGEMTLCNLDTVTPKFDAFLEKAEAGKSNISIHNGDAIAKFSRAAAVDCKLTAKSVVSQMATVSEAVTKLELYAKKFDAMGLSYEKEVDRLKEIEKVAALNKAKAEYAEHVADLQAEVKPIVLVLPPVDFQLAIKGLKTVESKNNAMNTALANGKIAADAIAKDIRNKLAWCKENAAGKSELSPDLQQIIYKPMDDFTLLITSRIKEAAEREQARIDAETVRIRAEEEAKARAKVTEENALAAQIKPAQTVPVEPAKADNETLVLSGSMKEVNGGVISEFAGMPHKITPSRESLAKAVAFEFGVSIECAEAWLVEVFSK